MSAWTVIAHTEVGSGGASTIEFLNTGNIASTYTDLLLVMSLRTARSQVADEVRIYFNSANSNLSTRYLEGAGSGTPASNTTANGLVGLCPANNATANTFGNLQVYIPNYAGSTNKSFSSDAVTEHNATEAYQSLVAGLWSQTSAITKITIVNQTSVNFVQYSSATLYGITKGSSGGVVVS